MYIYDYDDTQSSIHHVYLDMRKYICTRTNIYRYIFIYTLEPLYSKEQICHRGSELLERWSYGNYDQ